MTGFAVGQFRRDAQLPFAAHLHSGHAFIPSLDDFAVTQCELVGLIGIDGAVEFLARGEPAGVVHFHVVPGFGQGAEADLDVSVLQAGVGFDAVARDFGGRIGVGAGDLSLSRRRLGVQGDGEQQDGGCG